MWEDDNYTGSKHEEFSAADPRVHDIGFWDGDNEISSVKNRSVFYLCIYADDEEKGEWIRLAPGAFVPSLEESHDFDNEAESARVTNGNC